MDIKELLKAQREQTNFYVNIDEKYLGMETVIKKTMEDYFKSQKYKNAEDGINYYKLEHDILKRELVYQTPKGPQKSSLKNYKIKNGYHNLLTDQKISYIAGEEWELKADEKLENILETEYLDDDFLNNIVQEVAMDTANTGDAYLHYYLKDGKMEFIVYNATEIIPILDTKYNKNLEYVIRFYCVFDNGKKIFKVELWDKEYTTYYNMYIKGSEYVVEKDFSVEINPQPHFITYNNITETIKEEGYGVVPFIHFKNNKYSTTDLSLIKSLIDNLDVTESDWANLNENQITAAWLFKNLSPQQDLSEILNGINANGGAKVPEGVEFERLNINLDFNSKKERILDLTNKIYELGKGVNTNNAPQNISGVALKLMYQNLDLKANAFIKTNMQAFYNMYEIILNYVNKKYNLSYTIKDIEIEVNKALIVDKKENAEIKKLNAETMLILNTTLSQETILEELGYNAQEEMEKLDKQEIKDLGV